MSRSVFTFCGLCFTLVLRKGVVVSTFLRPSSYSSTVLEPQWFVYDGSIQFLLVLHHQLCLRELFFHGLGSGGRRFLAL
nr:hypothetical protein CFP56_15138 [Quercus suber]